MLPFSIFFAFSKKDNIDHNKISKHLLCTITVICSTLVLSGCTTTLNSPESINGTTPATRPALSSVTRENLDQIQNNKNQIAITAAKLNDTRWPQTTSTSIAGQMSNFIFGRKQKTSQTDPNLLVDWYLANLEKRSQKFSKSDKQLIATLPPASTLALANISTSNLPVTDVTLLLADANYHLNAARELSKLLAQHDSYNLTEQTDSKADIIIAENSIVQLRKNRTVYITTLKQLAANGALVEPQDIRLLKEAFLDAGRDLSFQVNGLLENINPHDSTNTQLSDNKPLQVFSNFAADR